MSEGSICLARGSALTASRWFFRSVSTSARITSASRSSGLTERLRCSSAAASSSRPRWTSPDALATRARAASRRCRSRRSFQFFDAWVTSLTMVPRMTMAAPREKARMASSMTVPSTWRGGRVEKLDMLAVQQGDVRECNQDDHEQEEKQSDRHERDSSGCLSILGDGDFRRGSPHAVALEKTPDAVQEEGHHDIVVVGTKPPPLADA